MPSFMGLHWFVDITLGWIDALLVLVVLLAERARELDETEGPWH
jgi:hypothetical protein